MYVPFVSEWFYGVWNGASGMAAAFQGGLDYGRKSGTTAGDYGRYTITVERVHHISDKNKSVTYRVLLESYLGSPSNATLETASKLIGTTLQAALEAATSATIAGGVGEPTGKVNYVWVTAPPAGDGTLQTEEERKAGGDVQLIKSAWLVRVQWS